MSQTENGPPNSPPERGERERLQIKAQECDAEWRANIRRLADSQENDVFKYVLLLTCVECHSYVTETQIQASRSFLASSCAAAAGFCLVALIILAMLFLPIVMDFKVEITTISLLSGVMTTLISRLFFKMYRESQERMERFHNDLREAQRIACGLFLKGIAVETSQCDEERREILRFLMHSDHRKGSTSGKHQEPDEVAA